MAVHLRDANSSASPRFALGHSLWALQQLSLPAEQYLKQLSQHGFESLEVGLVEDRLSIIPIAREEYGLKVIGQGWACDFETARPYIETAAKQKVWVLNMHLGNAYMSAQEAAKLWRDCRSCADAAGVQLSTEIHRACMTQDLYRTAEWVALTPDVSLTLDISHVIVAGTGTGGKREIFFKYLQPVLDQVVYIHARIGDTQCVQVDVGPKGESPHVALFLEIWTRAMKAWRASAKPGDVFLFEPELGPPAYAQTDLDGRQLSDRWLQSLVLAEIGKKAWAASANA